MKSTLDDLRTQLSELPIEERAELARFLIGTLDQECEPDLDAEWDTELARRTEEIRTGIARGEAAPGVLRRLRDRYS